MNDSIWQQQAELPEPTAPEPQAKTATASESDDNQNSANDGISHDVFEQKWLMCKAIDAIGYHSADFDQTSPRRLPKLGEEIGRGADAIVYIFAFIISLFEFKNHI